MRQNRTRASIILALVTLSAFGFALAGCRSGGMPATTTSSTATQTETTATAAGTATTEAAATASQGTVEGAAAVAKTETAAAAAVTGYDLYSWQAGGAWNFALLPGANRLRSFDEITQAEMRMQGVGSLKSKLRKLPQGEKVSWSARVVNTEMPGREIVDDVSRYCAQIGIDLSVSY